MFHRRQYGRQVLLRPSRMRRATRALGITHPERSKFSNLENLWWPGTESNRRRQPFQGCALPTELPGHFGWVTYVHLRWDG
jgi:IS5 family transposase